MLQLNRMPCGGTCLVALVVLMAFARGGSAQTSDRAREPFRPTVAQCGQLPALDTLLREITECKRANRRSRTISVRSCMTWWLGWPMSCQAPQSCTALVDRYYSTLTGSFGLRDRTAVLKGVGLDAAVNGQIRNACAAGSTPVTPPPANDPGDASPSQLSAAGRAALIRHEGIRRNYYNDPVGNCTFGAGTMIQPPRRCTAEELRTRVTDERINESLQNGIDQATRAVRAAVTNQRLTQQQFDALVSFTYNLGAGGARSVLQQVNNGDLVGARESMLRYTRATQRNADGTPQRDANGNIITRELPGLVRRRRDEAAPFPPRPPRKTPAPRAPRPPAILRSSP